MNEFEVSVIVPVYNVKTEYLRECIESILEQSLKSVELVLISDGAGDEQKAVLSEYENTNNVQVIYQENRGVCVARNVGIDSALGRYITFVDSDDYIDKDTCLIAVKTIKERDADVLFWGSYKFDSEKCEKYMPYTKDVLCFDEISKKNLQLKTMSGTLPIFEEYATKYGAGSVCSKLYEKKFLVKNNLRFIPGIKRAEDVNFHIRVFEKASKISYLNKNLYYYRQNEESATYQYRDGGIAVFTDALNALWDFVKDKDSDFKEVFYMRCMFFLIESMDMDYLNKHNNKSFFVRARELRAVFDTEPYKNAISSMDGRFLSLAKKIPYYLIKFKQAKLLMLFYTLYRKV